MKKNLTTIMSNAHVLYTKLHNYHWNVKGLEFYKIHEKTEELYNHFALLYDDIAERLLQIGETPVVTLKQILEMSTLKEEDKTSFDSPYVIKNILADFETLRVDFLNLSKLAQEDATTQAYADEQVAFLEKEIWMLKALLG